MDNVKSIVAKNLAELRKAENLTQTALAKMLNYSDKAVSKWECGDSLPDLDTLVRLADFYGVTLDYLVNDDPEEKAKRLNAKSSKGSMLGNRIIISAIAVVSVFLVSTIIFIYEILMERDLFLWKAFLWAIPVSCVVLFFFFRRWKSPRGLYLVLFSLFNWSLITCIYLQLGIYEFWYVFLIGIPVQVLIVLGHILRTR